MILSERTAHTIRANLIEYLGQGRFVYLWLDETDCSVSLSTSHRLTSMRWRDDSDELVRIFQDEKVRISFSISRYFFSIHEGESVTFGDGIKIRRMAGNGHKILDWLKLEGTDDE